MQEDGRLEDGEVSWFAGAALLWESISWGRAHSIFSVHTLMATGDMPEQVLLVKLSSALERVAFLKRVGLALDRGFMLDICIVVMRVKSVSSAANHTALSPRLSVKSQCKRKPLSEIVMR